MLRMVSIPSDLSAWEPTVGIAGEHPFIQAERSAGIKLLVGEALRGVRRRWLCECYGLSWGEPLQTTPSL